MHVPHKFDCVAPEIIIMIIITVITKTKSQHSQECKDPRQQCFCDS